MADTHVVRLSESRACDALHKFGILLDEPELQESYGLTSYQTDVLFDTIPHKGGLWKIPSWAFEVVAGEMGDFAGYLRGECGNADTKGQELAGYRDAKFWEDLVKGIGKGVY